MLCSTGSTFAIDLAKLARLIARRPRRAARRFLRHQKGATAVEFGFVAAPFIALMVAIMETGLVFFATQTLETAVADSARLVMTGQAQEKTVAKPNGMTIQDFKKEVCDRLKAMFKCDDLYLDVQSYTTFGGIDSSIPIDATTGNFTKDASLKDPDPTKLPPYNPGSAGDIVVVRVMYQWPIYADRLGLYLSNIAGTAAHDKRLLTATAAFRNEPF